MSAASETPAPASSRREPDDWKAAYYGLLDRLIDSEREKCALRKAMSSETPTPARLLEHFHGVVRQSDEEEVVVTYEVDGDLVEQTYHRDQFQNCPAPVVGDRVSVLVRLIVNDAGESPDEVRLADELAASLDGEHAEPLSREF